jgi:biofilm protein TabA
MITGTQKTISRLLPHVSGRLKQALTCVEKLDLQALPLGKTLLDGDRIFASVNEYETELVTQRRPEKHFTHIDIQLVASGRESIGYTDVENVSDLTEDRRETNDVVFYGHTEKENFIDLETGDLAIFFPWEVHRPNCYYHGEKGKVKKVVVKVKVD